MWKNGARDNRLHSNNTFPEDVAEKIIGIPLAEEPHDDFRVWSAEASGEFTVRSAYKLLQSIEDDPRAYALQYGYEEFYKKLWILNLPSKIKITIWKISWNFLATRVNLLQKKLTNTSACPRCGAGSENMDHLFRECPGYLRRIQYHSVGHFAVPYGQSVREDQF